MQFCGSHSVLPKLSGQIAVRFAGFCYSLAEWPSCACSNAVAECPPEAAMQQPSGPPGAAIQQLDSLLGAAMQQPSGPPEVAMQQLDGLPDTAMQQMSGTLL
jgi:hypothetical protein